MSRRRRPSVEMESGRGGGHRVAGGASRRPRANPRSVGMWERAVAAVNHVFHAPAPLPFYIARATGAHQQYGLDAPDQGVFKGSGPIFGSGPWRSTPTKFIPYSILVYMEKWLHTTCIQAFSQFFYINDERIKYITYKLM